MWRERRARGQKQGQAAARRYLQVVSRKSAAAAAADSVITFFTYLTFKTCNEKCTKYINCTRVVAAVNAQRWKTPRDVASPLHYTAEVGNRRIIYIYHAERKCNKFAPQRIARESKRGTALARLLLGVICGFEALLRW